MKQPEYKKVYSILKQEIRDGEYKPGELLPPERIIEERFSVSRTTVRRALELLAQDGYVKAEQGRGTEVLDFTTVQRLNGLTSISETLKSKGLAVSTKSIHIDRVEAGKRVAQALEIREGDFVVRIQRVQCANEQPIAIMTNYLLEGLVPGIERCGEQIGSLYSFLEKEYHIVLASAIENLSAGVTNFSEAQILNVPVGWPLLVSKRVTYSTHNRPIEFAHIRILVDKYEYAVYMENRP